MPRREFAAVMIEDGEEFLVVEVCEGSARLILAQKPEMCEELAEPDVGREVKHLCQNR